MKNLFEKISKFLVFTDRPLFNTKVVTYKFISRVFIYFLVLGASYYLFISDEATWTLVSFDIGEPKIIEDYPLYDFYKETITKLGKINFTDSAKAFFEKYDITLLFVDFNESLYEFLKDFRISLDSTDLYYLFKYEFFVNYIVSEYSSGFDYLCSADKILVRFYWKSVRILVENILLPFLFPFYYIMGWIIALILYLDVEIIYHLILIPEYLIIILYSSLKKITELLCGTADFMINEPFLALLINGLTFLFFHIIYTVNSVVKDYMPDNVSRILFFLLTLVVAYPFYILLMDLIIYDYLSD